jgi:tRNA A37 threonylcarbamoyladenosine dehydratase
MKEKFERIIPYYGKEKFETLQSKKVLVFGLGGVGGYVVDGLIRNGILNIGICDGDKVELSNFNRQIIALESNLNKQKVNAMEERILDINSDVNVTKYDFFVDENTINDIDFTKYDLIIDCIDDVKAKIMIIEKAKLSNVEIISCMGTANKNDPNAFKIVDINQTSYCPLAKKVRTELKKKNISNVKVCFSNEVINNNSNVLLSPLYVVASSSYVILKEAIKVLLSD